MSASAEGLLDELRQRLNREILDIEDRNDLSRADKVAQITHITCATCAGVAIQPIPFADIFILTPIQAFMGSHIAAIHDLSLKSRGRSVATGFAVMIASVFFYLR